MLYDACLTQLRPVLETSHPQVIAVGYSGGVDSQVLLHLLSRFRNQYPQHHYLAVHIHHGLSPNADLWQKHCQHWATEWGIEFTSRRIEVRPQARTSLEAQAREGRYAAFRAVLPQDAQLLLAQHQDDQLETVLLQLKRGSGPKGLAGIPAKIERDGLMVHRPLLHCGRSDILWYANEHNLEWVEDESNQDCRYDRNFLRQRILPELTNRWPDLATTVSRSAQLCGEQQALLDEVCLKHLAHATVTPTQLDIRYLNQLSDQWLSQVVRYWLAQLNVPMPARRLLQRLRPELLAAAEDANPCLQWQEHQLRRFRTRLCYWPYHHTPAPWSAKWHLDEPMLLPDGRLLEVIPSEAQKESGDNQLVLPNADTLEVGQGHMNQRFRPAGSPVSKPLKQWLKLWQVPPWEREQCVWLRQGDGLIGILGPGWVRQGELLDAQGARQCVLVRQTGKSAQ